MSFLLSLKRKKKKRKKEEGFTDINTCSFCRIEDVGLRLVELKYLVFTRMPGESYHRRLRSLLLCLSRHNPVTQVFVVVLVSS